MSDKKLLNEEQLEKVSGGDLSNPVEEASDTASGITPIYSVGDKVKLWTGCGTMSKWGTVKSIRADIFKPLEYPNPLDNMYVPYYTINIPEENRTVEVTSQEIIDFRRGEYTEADIY